VQLVYGLQYISKFLYVNNCFAQGYLEHRFTDQNHCVDSGSNTHSWLQIEFLNTSLRQPLFKTRGANVS